MRIKVNNLGAIGNGSIDLSKRLNILCGYNGTGKTYLSYLIYGLLSTRLHVRADDDKSEALINNRQLIDEIDFNLLLNYRAEMLKSVKTGVDAIFGISEEDANRIFSDFNMDFEESEDEYRQTIVNASIDVMLDVQGVNVRMQKQVGDASYSLKIIDENISNNLIRGFKLFLKSEIYFTLAIYPISQVYVFPVERNSIYTFSKELSIRKQEAMDNIQLLVDKDKKLNKFDILLNSKRYPLPIRDGLMIADDLVEVKKRKGVFYDFAEVIEAELLHGNVQISSDGEIQFRPTKSKRTILPIQMTASIVKTLSSLVVYLKHIAKANDLIIIDEPEINLHPDNQILLARLFARLANVGFRLLISTHSDYIIREFNNLVMASQIKNRDGGRAILEELGYGESEYINMEELGVYFFAYRNKKSKHVIVSALHIDRFGVKIQSIDDVIDDLNKNTESLYYTLKYGEYGE